jgi:hypothetical protein
LPLRGGGRRSGNRCQQNVQEPALDLLTIRETMQCAARSWAISRDRVVGPELLWLNDNQVG